jgi:acetone carboxylase gamma subunit
MNSTVQNCMNTFVQDTTSATHYKDIISFLADHPQLQQMYVAKLARKLTIENQISSPLAEQVSLHLCQRQTSPVQQFFENHWTSPNSASEEAQKGYVTWPIRFHTTQSIGQVYKNE